MSGSTISPARMPDLACVGRIPVARADGLGAVEATAPAAATAIAIAVAAAPTATTFVSSCTTEAWHAAAVGILPR